MNISYKLRKIRKEKDMTLKELSNTSGLSISFLSDIEHERRQPSNENLRKIANGLNISIAQLTNDSLNNVVDSDELKILFSKIRDLSKDDQKRINAIVEAFKKENQK